MSFFGLLDLVSIFIAVAIGFFIYSRDVSNNLNKIFLVNCLLSAYTSFCEGIRFLSPNVETAVFWSKFSFLWPYLPLSFLLFTIYLIDEKLKNYKIHIIILSLISTYIMIFHVSTDFLYTGVEKTWYGWQVVTAKNFNTAIIAISFNYFTLFSLFIIIKFYLKLKDAKRKKQIVFAAIGFSIPFLAGFFTEGLLPSLDIRFPPLTSIFFIIGAIFLSIGLLKYKFLLPDPMVAIRKLFSGIADYLVIYNEDGIIVLASDSFIKCTGYNENDVIGTHISNLVSFSDHTIKSHLFDLTGKEVSASIVTKHDELIPVDVRNSLITEKLHQEKLMLMIGRDLRERKKYEQELLVLHSRLEERVRERTEDLAKLNLKLTAEIIDHKNTEEALRISEKRFRDLFENSPTGIYRTTPEGKILLANPAIIKLLGYSSFEELAQRNLESGGYQDFSRRNFKNMLEQIGEIKGIEVKWLKKDGSIVTVRENARCITDKDGEILFYEGTVEDITQQVKTFEALKESEEQFRDLAEQSPNMIFMFQGKRITYVNDKSMDVLGYSKEYLMSQEINLPDFVFGNTSVIDEILSEKFLNDNNTITRQITLISSQNKLVETLCSFKPLNYRGGRAILGVVVDVTERIEFEKALKESEERYRSIFENTSAVMLLVDPDTYTIVSANKAAVRYYGYSNKDLSGMNVFNIDISRNTFSGIRNWYDLDTSEEIQAIHKLSNGDSRDVHIKCGKIPIRGKIVLFLIVFDVTQRRLAEKQLEDYKIHLENLVKERTRNLDEVNNLLKNEIDKLRIAEESIQEQYIFLQTLIDTIPNPIYMRDSSGLFTGCNKPYERFFGKQSKDILGKPLDEIYTPEETEQIKINDQELLREGIPQKHEFKLKDSNGKTFDMLIYKALFHKTDGSIGGIVGILIDITEIKKLESEVRNSLEKEKELSELKSRFISVASHEFRTPLTSILSSADLLELYGRKWPETKYYEYVGHIQNAVEYMTELINDVLVVSRSDTGQLKFAPGYTNLDELINKIISDVKTTFPKEIWIEYEFIPEEKVYYLDNKLITQILTNLLSNAIKYSKTHGKVMISVRTENDQLFISVCDNGIGITEDDQKCLFQPFYRGANVGSIPGTGLGLSIASKSAELHKGKLFVNSKLNEGTTITLVL